MKVSKIFKKEESRRLLADGGVILLSALLFSAGVNMFIEPAALIMGGVTGLATAVNILFGAPPIGTMTLLLNLPLLLLVWKVYGFRFICKTAVATVGVSIGMDLLQFWPTEEVSPLLAAIFGGIATGVAMGLLFSRGYNTGGTDLLVYLLRRRFKNLSAGMLIFVIDCVIVALSALALRSFESVFYSAITIYAQTKALDLVISGFRRGRAVFVISEKEKEIAKALAEDLERGVTILQGKGYFSGEQREVLLCAIPSKQIYKLKMLVKTYDPSAFIIITDAAEIAGYGFEERGI